MIENIVTLKIVLQNPNLHFALVSKTGTTFIFVVSFSVCVPMRFHEFSSERDNWKLAVHVKLFFTVAANEDLLPFPS